MQEYWSGLPFPSPGDLPNPGIEPRSPALQANSLVAEPRGKSLSHLGSTLLISIDMRMNKCKDSAHQKVKGCLLQTTPFSVHVSPAILKPPPSLSLALGSPTHAAPLRKKPLIQAASDVSRAWDKGKPVNPHTPYSGSSSVPQHEGLHEASGLGLPTLGLGIPLPRFQAGLRVIWLKNSRVPGTSSWEEGGKFLGPGSH